ADVAGGHALQAIVANGRGGTQAGRDIAGIDDVALLGGVAPDASEAVRLEFEPYREMIAFRRFATPQVGDALLDPEKFLHVMPDLMRDDVGLRELAGRAEAAAQLVEEGKVDVDLFVGWAVKRAGGGLRGPAS